MQKDRLKQYLIVSLLLIAGTLAWSITMIKSGIEYSYGIGFLGANGHDGVWHIALINSLSRGFEMPVFSGSNIKNYHLLFDLAIAQIHNITRIPTINLYFQITPPILAFLIGLSCFSFVSVLTKSKRSALWSTFFV